MRIALFTETYLPHINGVVTHVKILRDGLEQLGHEVLVVTADADAHHHFVEDGVLHCPAHTSKRFYNYSLSLPVSSTRLKFVRDFAPDIIHIHNEFGIGMSGLLCAKILRVPLVYTLHTMYDDYIYYIAPKPLVKAATKVSRRYFKFIAKHSNALTGPSQKCQEYFRLTGLKKDVSVIPNAVEVDQFSPREVPEEVKADLRERCGIRDDSMVACFVGRLGREKSVDVLLDYWKAGVKPEDHIHLVVIGDGPVRPELEEQAKALGIEDMVTFTGRVEHEDLPPYYALCDVYVTASLSDTNSISMLEGMCSGLPVLQRNDPLNADQVRDGKNGFNFDSPEEMAQKLRQIQAMDQEALQGFKESVIASIRENGARELAERTLTVYQRVLKK
ncbi:MAG: glycosyltransferase family 4 protein [Angelakisella sp.]|jgi:1,2-diacylglycerol 3-alpha-glucosyltransferase|nr:glycosyltransferase family 4 protein [Angelakisella sp.]